MFLYFLKKNNETNIEKNSENGITNHNPFNLKRLGNNKKPIIQNMKVLKKESNAEIFPLEKAVNNPET